MSKELLEKLQETCEEYLIEEAYMASCALLKQYEKQYINEIDELGDELEPNLIMDDEEDEETEEEPSDPKDEDFEYTDDEDEDEQPIKPAAITKIEETDEEPKQPVMDPTRPTKQEIDLGLKEKAEQIFNKVLKRKQEKKKTKTGEQK